MRPSLCVAAAGLLLGSTVGLCAAPAVGVALTHGGLTLNRVFHAGNAPVFQGTLLETAHDPAQVQFQAGGTLRFAPDSRATIYTDHLILEQGAIEVRDRSYEVDANTLRITGASARVTLKGRAVQVGAVSAPVAVANGNGVLVAKLEPGQALELTPEQDAVTSVLHGCLARSAHAYVLTDRVSKVTAELRGSPDLERDVGRSIEAAGTLLAGATPVQQASQVIQVARLKVQQPKCSVGPVGLLGAGGMLGGLSTTTVVAGVVVAAVVVATPLGLLAVQSNGTQVNLSPVQ